MMKTVKFGMYPQSLVTDEVLVNKLNDLANGKCVEDVEYENEKYRALCKDGKLNWFKYEPIVFYQIDEKTLFSKLVLDTKMFDKDNSDYDNSFINKWLNDDFFCIAFKDEKDNIEKPISLISKDMLESVNEKELYSGESSDYAKALGLDYEDNLSVWWLKDNLNDKDLASQCLFDLSIGTSSVYLEDAGVKVFLKLK